VIEAAASQRLRLAASPTLLRGAARRRVIGRT
jgi:hypothetical protein